MTASSPLPVQRLRHLIDAEGAVSIATYMAIANTHYYATRDPLGRSGDFTTAPEISQMFGELIGLWLADLWTRAGCRDAALVELGPGRGTLMSDIRRAVASVPGLAGAPVHLVETSPALRTEQARRLPDAHWHDSVATLPADRPLLVVANEFFDALPIRQFVRVAGSWRERMVALEGERFVPRAGHISVDALIPAELANSPEGSIIETSPASIAIAADLAARIARQGGGVLVIDYGHQGPAVSDTLQAVRKHAYADVFDMAGEADLTAHVDFTALAAAMQQAGALSYGPVEQGALLLSLGIAARAERLKRANPSRAAALDGDVARLTAPTAMGRIFKALAVTAPGWPVPAGFPLSRSTP